MTVIEKKISECDLVSSASGTDMHEIETAIGATKRETNAQILTYIAANIALAASKITSGTIAAARLGSGTADSTTFLRGDQTYATPPGVAVLNVNTTAVGNVGGGEDDLITYAVAGGTLGTNGQYVHFVATGKFAASINNKRLRAYLGATLLFDTGALAISAAADWSLEGEIIRVDGTHQITGVRFTSSSATIMGFSQEAEPTETLSGSLTLKLTGAATADDDVVQKTLIVEKYTA